MMLEEDLTERATDALLHWRGREVFPTDMSSAELRGFSKEFMQRSITSARTTNADYLNEVDKVVDEMLSGRINLATGRLRLMRKLKELGYDPEKGFPQDMAMIPPAERGSLQDLSSEPRLNLMLETLTRMAANYGRMVEGNSEYARHAYPAWELVRLFLRAVPRGSAESHSIGWERRWRDAGEAVGWEGALEAPMIARKDAPIWQALGDGEGGYLDTLSNPFPPFAFHSGLAWKAVDRERCLALGLVTAAETVGEMDGQLSPGAQEVKEVFARMSPELREELRRELADDGERERLRKAQEEHVARQSAIHRERLARSAEDLESGRKFVGRLVA